MNRIFLSNRCFKKLEKIRLKGKQHSILIETILDIAKLNGTLDEVVEFLYGEYLDKLIEDEK